MKRFCGCGQVAWTLEILTALLFGLWVAADAEMTVIQVTDGLCFSSNSISLNAANGGKTP